MIAREPAPTRTLEQLESPERRDEDMLKFRCLYPEMFAELQYCADTITQVYLNHPDEPYQLKLEEISQSDGTITYRAVLDGMSEFTTEPIHQHVETDITEEAYKFYSEQAKYPQLRKQRYEMSPGVIVDWYGEQDVVLKIDIAANVPDVLQFSQDLYEHVDSPLFDDEPRAEAQYNYLRKSPADMLAPLAKLHPKTVAADIAQHQQTHLYTFITVTGRSGSGKTEIRTGIKKELAEFRTDASFAELSTDDYHRGLTWLTEYNRTVNGSKEPWDDWDSRVVYDVEKAREEIAELLRGESISQRAYDFDNQEPVEKAEQIQPAKIIILEGLHAGDPVFADIADFRYEIPTGVATATGRRLLRDFRTGRASGDNVNTPENLLRYMIERAEPAYQGQKR